MGAIGPQPPEPPFALWDVLTDLPPHVEVPWITDDDQIVAVGLRHGADDWQDASLCTWNWRSEVPGQRPVHHALLEFSALLGTGWAPMARELSAGVGSPWRLNLAGDMIDARRFDTDADCWVVHVLLPDVHIAVAGRRIEVPTLRQTTLAEWYAREQQP